MAESRLAVVPLAEIEMGERFRKDYKNIPELAQDIRTRGLILPIAVMEKAEGGYLLLAGGRRLTAHQLLNSETIECKVFPSGLSELEIRCIELMENVVREDLSFFEEANLQREILKLQKAIHGEKVSTNPDAPGASQQTVANLLGISREKLRQNIELANTMEMFPDVDWKNLKNRQEAVRLKDNIGKLVVRQEAVKRFEKEVNPNQHSRMLKRIADSYIHGNFFDHVQEVPDNSINLVEVDPPYAINLEKAKAKTGIGNFTYNQESYNEIDRVEYGPFMFRVFKECYRVLAPNSFLLCWFSPDPWFHEILSWIRQVGFTCRGLPCVWVKGEDELGTDANGQTLSPMRHLASSYEMFFYAKKGDPRIVKQGRSNVFGFKPVSPNLKTHPTERPKELMREILSTFAIEGSKVMIPFAGSGVTIEAAYEEKMMAFGMDLGLEFKEAFVAKLYNKTTLPQ